MTSGVANNPWIHIGARPEGSAGDTFSNSVVPTLTAEQVADLTSGSVLSSTVGDGVADDTEALNEVAAALPVGGTLRLEAGKRYRITSTLNFSNVGKLIGNGAFIVPDATLLDGGGNAISMGYLISNTTLGSPIPTVYGSHTFTLPTGIAASVGDLIRFLSTDLRPVGFGYYEGMSAIVTGVDGQDITISRPFYGAFNVTSISVYRGYTEMLVEGLNVDMRNAEASHASTLIGLTIIGTNMVIRQCRFYGNLHTYVALNASGENLFIYGNVFDTFLRQLGYGVSSSANNTLVLNNTFVNCRHGFTTAPRTLVTQNICIEANYFADDTNTYAESLFSGSIDAHSNHLDRFVVRNNYVSSHGTLIQARNAKCLIEGNTLIQNNAAGPSSIAINGAEQGFDEMIIRDNNVTMRNTTSYLIGNKSFTSNVNTFENVEISGNKINGGSFFYCATITTVRNLVVRNNTLTNGVAGLDVQGNPAVFEDVVVENNHVEIAADRALVYFAPEPVKLAGFYQTGSEAVVKNLSIVGNTVINGRVLMINDVPSVQTNDDLSTETYLSLIASVDGVLVANNTIREARSLVFVASDCTTPFNSVAIKNNVANSVAVASAYHLVSLSSYTTGTKTLTFDGLDVSGNVLDASQNTSAGNALLMNFITAINLSVIGNDVRRNSFSTTSALRFIDMDMSEVVVANNKIDGFIRIGALTLDAAVDRAVVTGNTTSEVGGIYINDDSSDNFTLALNEVSFTNNVVNYFDIDIGALSTAASGPMGIHNNTIASVDKSYSVRISPRCTGNQFIIGGNVLGLRAIDQSGTYYRPLIGNSVLSGTQTWKAGIQIRADGSYYSSTQPASGTWSTGDIVYRAPPSGANGVGWVCSAGGTPGTWLQFGLVDRVGLQYAAKTNVSVTPPVVAAQSQTSFDVTVSGAVAGDLVTISPGLDSFYDVASGLVIPVVFTARVNGTDNVNVRAVNPTSSSFQPKPSTWTINLARP